MDLNGYFDFRCADFGEVVLEVVLEFLVVNFDMLKIFFSSFMRAQPLPLLQRALAHLDRPRRPDDVRLELQVMISSTGSLGGYNTKSGHALYSA